MKATLPASDLTGDKLARFLENHDEPRAASSFAWPQHQVAAVITFLSTGLRFFYDGQFEGAKVRVPTHLCKIACNIDPLRGLFAPNSDPL